MTGTEILYRAARCASGQILIGEEPAERLLDGAVRIYGNTIYSPAELDSIGWRPSPLEAVQACVERHRLGVVDASARLATAQDDLAVSERALAGMQRKDGDS